MTRLVLAFHDGGYMKTRNAVLVVVFLFALSSVSFGSDQAMDTLNETVKRISAVLNDIDKGLQETAGRIGKGLGANTDMRGDIRSLCAGKSYAVDCSFSNSKGIVQIVEPEKYRKYEGSDLSAQSVTARIMRLQKPTFSELFVGIEEVQATLLAYPVFTANREFAGSVGIFFSPELLVKKALEKFTLGKGVVVMVLEADGMHVFSTDPAQVRRSTLVSPEYKGFPELRGLVGMMVSKEEGSGTYQYIRPGTQKVVRKRAIWKTVSLYDGFWRVVVTEEEKQSK